MPVSVRNRGTLWARGGVHNGVGPPHTPHEPHCDGYARPHWAWPMGAVRVEDDPAAVRDALDYLPPAQARVAEQHPHLSIATDVRVGEPAEGIEQAVASLEAALVVMATHGRGRAMRAILGSVAGKLVQHCDVPVVVMRPAPVEANQLVDV